MINDQQSLHFREMNGLAILTTLCNLWQPPYYSTTTSPSQSMTDSMTISFDLPIHFIQRSKGRIETNFPKSGLSKLWTRFTKYCLDVFLVDLG
jgi:hypothetical protein